LSIGVDASMKIIEGVWLWWVLQEMCIADRRDSIAKTMNLSVYFKSSVCNLSIMLEVKKMHFWLEIKCRMVVVLVANSK